MTQTVPPRTLSHDEKKAAEAAFRGLPCDPHWTPAAQAVYHGIVDAVNTRGGEPPAQTDTAPSAPEAVGPEAAAAGEKTESSASATDQTPAETEEEALPSSPPGLSTVLRSREEAIQAGVLIDVTEEAESLGLPMPVGLTKALWDLTIASSEDLSKDEQDQRLRDVLLALRLRLSTSQPGLPLFEFPALLAFPPEPVPKLCSLLALVHADSSAQQAVTLVLRDELSTIVSPLQN